jgi:phosphatidylserine/phosphatidylglycerophosphate/cardiolipin synthase-like enzyme
MDDMNRSAVSKLHKYSKAHSGDYSGRLGIFMTDRMLHAKLLMSERRVIIGSCNINRKSFTKLDELAITVDNDDSPFAEEIRSSVGKSFQNAECVSTRDRISYHPVLAALETAVM